MSVSITISTLITQGEQALALCSDTAKLDSQLILAFVLCKPITYLLTWPDNQLTAEQINAFQALLVKRVAGEPIAYLLGEREFWSLALKVAPSTLIPRPDTEVLVETVLAHHDNKALSCCDLGTGTGAIALALASERDLWQIEAIDYSDDAVALAKENASALGLTQVKIYQSDWFSNVANDKFFDIIVSNPPYIDKNDPHLTQGDVRFEPLSALVADNKGLADIETIAKQALNQLNDHGMIYFEHGFEQGQSVRELLTQLGYHQAETVQDYNQNERVTYARFIGKN